MMKIRHAIFILLGLCLTSLVSANDWPDYMGGHQRTGAIEEQIRLGNTPAWIYRSDQKPMPGFQPKLAGNDTGGPQRLVTQTSTFDYAFAPIIADGKVLLPVSSMDAMVCLDAKTGRRLWIFYTEGAVRLAPVVVDQKVLFGSDDGHVYCLRAANGSPIWKYSAAETDRRIIANGRMASQSLVRTGITVRDGVCYFASGILPAVGGTLIHAVDLETGKAVWKEQTYAPPIGYILATDDTLIIPTGRSAPIEHELKTGKSLTLSDLGFRRQGGGSIIQQLGDYVVYGPTEAGILRVRVSTEEPEGRDYNSRASARIRGTLTGLNGRRITMDEEAYYILRGDEIVAIPRGDLDKSLAASAAEYDERKNKRLLAVKSQVQLRPDRQLEQEIDEKARWTAECKTGVSLIRTADTVYVGSKDKVFGFDRKNGEKKHELAVEGTAWEMAAADGALYVSTDTGALYCFSANLKTANNTRKNMATPGVPDSVQQHAKDALNFDLLQPSIRPEGKGFCLVLGLEDGSLVRSVAEQSQMQVIGIDSNPEKIEKARAYLESCGRYGGQTALHHIPAGEPLPYPSYFANLTVSERVIGEEGLEWEAEDISRVMRPLGILLFRGESRELLEQYKDRLSNTTFVGSPSEPAQLASIRPDPEGMGNWTHMFADPANTSCSNDELVGGLDYGVQWIGAPDPSEPIGWHADGMSPLYHRGRLFLMKRDRIEAVDAYTGALLWTRDIPNFYRTNPGREGGSACIGNEALYVVTNNKCLMMDCNTGETISQGSTPEPGTHWGYVAVAEGKLLGTAQHPKATVYDKDPLSRMKSMWAASEPLYVLSDRLFMMASRGARLQWQPEFGDKNAEETPQLQWQYGDGNRRILNPTITVGGGHVFFIEGRGDDIVADEDASMRLRDFYQHAPQLVALDLQTGEKVFEKPFDIKAQAVLYLSYRDGKLIVTSSYLVGPKADVDVGSKAARSNDTILHYLYTALDAGSGKKIWQTELKTEAVIGTQHNYNVAHPVITKDAVWHSSQRTSSARIDLATGELEQFTNRRDKGCSMASGSSRAMFYRSMGIATFDFTAKKQEIVSSSNRPSCWLSILPAGGLLLMPEGSIGCNCAFPLQTSIALMPME